MKKILFAVPDMETIGGIQNVAKKISGVIQEAGILLKVVERKRGGLLAKLHFTLSFVWNALVFRPTLIVCIHINFAVVAYFLHVFLRIPFTVELHGVEAVRITDPLKRRAVRTARIVVAPFRWTMGNILRQFPEVERRSFILPNSVDGERFHITGKPEALKRTLGIGSEKVICTVARLSSLEIGGKGYDRVIESLPRVRERIPDIKYVIVGDGDDRPRVEALINRLHLRNHVTITGAVPDQALVEYYNLADVFVLPSKGEGFPAIVLLEALACGTPIVGGNRECGDEAFANGELGILVDPDDRGAIAGAIISIVSGTAPKLLKGEALRRRTLEVYGLEKSKARIREFIEAAYAS
ncbi:MAG: glycosyltransferase family 4 protein [bacterium]|nr:glycosyltransferase family 4 protein [bacterium]